MLTSAEDVRRDTVARLGFPSWDRLWLAHMLMLGCLSSLSFSLHKIICFIWASNQAFHHLLALNLVLVTKERFWQSAKTDCHNVLLFKKLLALPDYFLRLKDRWLVAAWENWMSRLVWEWFNHSNQQTVSKREWRQLMLGVLESLWLKTSRPCSWVKLNHNLSKANSTSASLLQPGRKFGTLGRCKVSR